MTKAAKHSAAGPHLALLAVQLIFGTWGIPAKIALRVITPFGLTAIRVVVAAAAFVLVGRIAGNFTPIRRPDWFLLIAASLLGIVFNQWLFVSGLALTTVVNTVLITTTMPIFTLIIGAVAGVERASFRRAVGIVVAAAGVIYLISPTRVSTSVGSRLGDLLILSSAFLYAAYIVISKPLVKTYGALPTIAWIFVVATIPTVPVGAASLTRVSFAAATTVTWAAVLYIVIVPTVLAYFLNAWALKQVPPSTVAVYIYVQPLVAFLVAPAVLGEAFTSRTVIASALVFTGVAITSWRRRRAAVPADGSEFA